MINIAQIVIKWTKVHDRNRRPKHGTNQKGTI